MDHLDRRTQTDATSGLRQGTQQMQKNVEVCRQERVKIGEALFTEVRVVILGVLQFGIMPQSLAVSIEQLAKLGLTSR